MVTKIKVKRFFVLIICFIMLATATGCWDYEGLGQLVIVAGVAIDKIPDGDDYLVSFEIVDLTASSKQEGLKPKVIESTGKTIFEAIRNAKQKLTRRLYFGSAPFIIVSEQIAKEDGLYDALDFFLRDAETRETDILAVSKEKTAKDIFTAKGSDNTIISYQNAKIVQQDEKLANTTKRIEIHQAFNELRSQRKCVVLPAFKNVPGTAEGELVNTSDGVAVFKDDRLVGYLTPEETRYFLYAQDDIEGGILAFKNVSSSIDRITFEIESNKTKREYSITNNKLKVTLSPKLEVYFAEVYGNVDIFDKSEVLVITEKCEKMLADEIRQVIKKVQKEYGADIFGFENEIYNKQFKTWKQYRNSFEELFINAEIEVKPKIKIIDSALTNY